MAYAKIGICLLAIICLFQTATALKCYQCESMFMPACGETMNVNMVPVVDCSKIPRPRYITGNKNATSCVKMIKEDRGKSNIVRACFFENSLDTKSKCLIDPSAQSVYKSCDLCTSELCNGSSSVYASFAIFAAAVIWTLNSMM